MIGKKGGGKLPAAGKDLPGAQRNVAKCVERGARKATVWRVLLGSVEQETP